MGNLLLSLVNVGFGVHEGQKALLELDKLCLCILLLQHVGSNEIIQVVEYLYPHHLIEQTQGFRGAHPQEVRQALRIRRGAVEEFYFPLTAPRIVLLFQPFLPVALAIKLAEVLFDEQLEMANAKRPPQLSVRKPAQLEQRNLFLVGIGKGGQQDGMR